MNIYQRLNEIRKAVAYVQKDKKVGEGGGYMAVTHDAVTRLTRDAMIEHGVMIVPSLIRAQTVLTGTTTAKGIPFVRYEATYEFRVLNVEDKEDCFAIQIESHALDQGDKAPGKALSYAKKYCVLKLLEIESGEEEEEREFQKHKVTPNAGAGDGLTKEQKATVEGVASSIIDCFEAGEPDTAFDVYADAKLDNECKLFLWTFLDSKMRSSIKKTGEERKKANV